MSNVLDRAATAPDQTAENEAAMMLDILRQQMTPKAAKKAKRALIAHADELETMASRWVGVLDEQRPHNVVRLRRDTPERRAHVRQEAGKLIARAAVVRAVIGRAF